MVFKNKPNRQKRGRALSYSATAHDKCEIHSLKQVIDHSNKMATMPAGKLVLDMALPSIVAMAVQALYNIVDSIFVSRIRGVAGAARATVLSQLFTMLLAFFLNVRFNQ